MSKTSKLLAVSALALAAGFFGTAQLQAGQVLPGDIIIAQGAGAGGAAGAGGSGDTSGSSDSGSGNQLGDRPGTQQPVPLPGASRAPSTQTEPSPTASVPSRCASMTDPVQRADCIRQNNAQQGVKPGASPNR